MCLEMSVWFEFVESLRGSRQIYYKNNLYNKHEGNHWRCNRCDAMISVNEKELMLIVEKEPLPAHFGHEDLPRLRIEVLKTIKKMKYKALHDDTATLLQIYRRQNHHNRQ